MTPVSPKEGYALWADTYDDQPNPVVTLNRRILRRHLGELQGRRFLDIATGTGFWLRRASAAGAHAFGVDLSANMLRRAAATGASRGRIIQADMEELPFRTGAADLALCSLAIGYLRNVDHLFQEMARVSKTVIVSDLHETAVRAGWTRSFRVGGGCFEIAQFLHTTSELDEAAAAAGLALSWREEASFSAPELVNFVAAGREHAFEAASRIPAVVASCWTRA